jgi:hypothetical protein
MAQTNEDGYMRSVEGSLSSTYGPLAKDIIERGAAQSKLPWQQYGATQAAEAQKTVPFRVAGLSDIEQNALKGVASLQGYKPMQYTDQSWTDPNRMQQFMSPYQQGVTDIATREAQRQADIASTQRGAQAVNAGAFGGYRQGIVDAEAGRNTSQLLNDIQTKGLQSAYTAGMGQFNAENAQDFQREYAQNMANLQGYNTGVDALAKQMQYGALPRDIAQKGMNVGYEDWQAKQAFPWENLNKLKNLAGMIPGQAQYASNESSNYQYNPLMQGAGVAGQVYDWATAPGQTSSSSTPNSSYTPNTSNLSFADSSTGPSYDSSFNSGIAKLPGKPD